MHLLFLKANITFSMNQSSRPVLFCLLTALLLSCGSEKEAPPPPETATPPIAAATLQGQVLFEGTVPPEGTLQMDGNPECRSLHPPGKIPAGEVLVQEGKVQNAFVYVKKGLEGVGFPAPTEAATVRNETCLYRPHVLGVVTGQPIEFLNSDPTLHNVHALPEKQKPWNVGLPFQGMKIVKKFSDPEVMVRLKCDLHPWMVGYIGVLPHPYFAVTGPDGRFELKNLPSGGYTIGVWHERFGEQEKEVTLGENEIKDLEFVFRT